MVKVKGSSPLSDAELKALTTWAKREITIKVRAWLATFRSRGLPYCDAGVVLRLVSPQQDDYSLVLRATCDEPFTGKALRGRAAAHLFLPDVNWWRHAYAAAGKRSVESDASASLLPTSAEDLPNARIRLNIRLYRNLGE